MDADAKCSGEGSIQTPADNRGGQKLAKSSRHLLWMAPKIKILFYKNKISYIVPRNYYYNSYTKLLAKNTYSYVNNVNRKAELL